MERRDAGPVSGTVGAEEVSLGPTPLHKLGYLLHYSLSSAGFVTALSDRFRSGAVSLPAVLQSCPVFYSSISR